jgi:hypothetical protein
MAGDLHSKVPPGSRQKGQVLSVPVETRAAVECVKWNWQRALQEVAEEWEVKGVCVNRGQAPE